MGRIISSAEKNIQYIETDCIDSLCGWVSIVWSPVSYESMIDAS